MVSEQDPGPVHAGEVQQYLAEIGTWAPVVYPTQGKLILRGRAALAGLKEVDPDTVVPAEVDVMLQAGVPDKTRETYEYQWGRFVMWCGVVGRNHDPATPETVRYYIWSHWGATKDGKLRGRRGRRYSPNTVALAVKVISIVHQWRGHASPCRHPSVGRQLDGYREWWNAAGYLPDTAAALSPAGSVAIARACDPRFVNGVRNAAMFRLQYDLGARASEIIDVNLEDLTWHRVLVPVDPDADVIELVEALQVHIVIRKTKTNRVPRTLVVEEVPGVDVDVDPCLLLSAWVDLLRERGYTSGPCFRAVNTTNTPRKDGTVAGTIRDDRIEFDDYEQAWKRYAAKAGVDRDAKGKPIRITTHSNRAGMITAARDAGMLAEEVAPRTGHKIGSNVIHGYWRGGTRTGAANAGTRIRRGQRQTSREA